MATETYDYIIVGGGTAGCVLANRLSADPGVHVLLLEAGGERRHPVTDIPLMLGFAIGNPRFDWMYQSAPEPHLGGRRVMLPRGRMLGGSSGLNGMVYVRGHRLDYDGWARLGNEGWGWADVLPFFIRSERFLGAAPPGHGTAGEWAISDPGMRWEVTDAYARAAAEAGIPPTADYNGGENEGVAYFQAAIARGRRQSTDRAFLDPVRDRPNLVIRSGALALRLSFEGRRAAGVLWRSGGIERESRARREIILCAGAYATPALLERSGIGAPAVLARIGVPVVQALPGVGENLQDHWQIRIQHRVHGTRTLNHFGTTLSGRLAMALRYALFRRGPLAAQPTLLAAFARVMEDAPAPDVQIHLSAASYDRVGGPLHRYQGITSSVCILRPEARGHVHAVSPDAEVPPEILHNFLGADYDREIALRAVALVRRIAAQPALARFRPEEVSPGPAVQSREDILAYAARVVSTVFHPVGTARMGRDPMAVVDPQLRVHGIEGLRIADASVMPTIPSGNTAAPVVMLAEKAADLIRGRAAAPAAA